MSQVHVNSGMARACAQYIHNTQIYRHLLVVPKGQPCIPDYLIVPIYNDIGSRSNGLRCWAPPAGFTVVGHEQDLVFPEKTYNNTTT